LEIRAALRSGGEMLQRKNLYRRFRDVVIGGILPPIVVCTIPGCERRDVGQQAQESPPVVRINGQTLLKRDFEAYLPDDYRSALTIGEKKAYLDRWITTELLYEAAVRSGVGVTPDIQSQLEQFKKDLVSDRLVQKIILERAVVTEKEVSAYYRAHEDEYTRELRVSHILVNSMEEAAKVKELLKNHTFSWVARRHSIDKHTGVGGDLGFLSKGNMLPEFEEVVFDMKIGEVSDVIESELGYHFVKVTDAREARNKLAYEDVAEDISRILMLEKRAAVYDSLITALKSDARIEILDPELRLLMDASSDTSMVGEGEEF
jgi:peptidyl-prolyl cis-trans isomerase C